MATIQDLPYDKLDSLQKIQYHVDNYQYDLAALLISIENTKAAERQAAALERIADSANSIDIAAHRTEERLTEIEGQLGRIAAALEWADNPSKMFWGEA